MSTSTKNKKESSDRIDRLIQERSLRIQELYFNLELHLMLVLLNDKNVLKRRLSEFRSLKKASEESLRNYRITPFGVHWEELDEDIGLKGLLEEEPLQRFKKSSSPSKEDRPST